MGNNFLKEMQDIAREGGHIALDFMHESAPTLKKDQSVLTKADIAISELIKDRLKGYLQTKDHILIDEEDPNAAEYLNQSVLDSTPYIWSVDPIDGTRGYSNRMPTYGVSIGLIKDLKPWLGVVYFPSLGEMFYCDGENSFFMSDKDPDNKVIIEPIDQEITQQSVFFGNEAFFKEFNWDFSTCQVMMPSCAVIDLLWPTVGRGCGCFIRAHLWDFAGAWPIIHSAGLKMRSLSSGKALEEVHAGLFKDDESCLWEMKEHHILCSERNFPLLKERIQPKS